MPTMINQERLKLLQDIVQYNINKERVKQGFSPAQTISGILEKETNETNEILNSLPWVGDKQKEQFLALAHKKTEQLLNITSTIDRNSDDLDASIWDRIKATVRLLGFFFLDLENHGQESVKNLSETLKSIIEKFLEAFQNIPLIKDRQLDDTAYLGFRETFATEINPLVNPSFYKRPGKRENHLKDSLEAIKVVADFHKDRSIALPDKFAETIVEAAITESELYKLTDALISQS